VVEFEGWREFFAPLLGWNERLLAELRLATRASHLATAERFPVVPIALNVRCGADFPPAPPGTRRLAFGQATPLPWFVAALRRVREAAGTCAPAFVVSDGGPDRLRPLLDEPSVTLVRPGCAISDLLVLSKARVLLASGSSSFSAWGAFLGGMPAASHPGQPLTDWRLPDAADGPPRVEFDPESPEARFLAAAASGVRNIPP
jgi:hypothetical protein